MKPKSCQYTDPNNCVCYNNGDCNFKKYNKIAVMKTILAKHQPRTESYKIVLDEIKDLKGEWFINSPKHNFCFWAWLQENQGERHTLAECAHLMDFSISQVANIEKKALDKLKHHARHNPDLLELFTELFNASDFNNLD